MRVPCSAVILISCSGFTGVISYWLQDSVEKMKLLNSEMLLSANVSVSKHDSSIGALKNTGDSDPPALTLSSVLFARTRAHTVHLYVCVCVCVFYYSENKHWLCPWTSLTL